MKSIKITAANATAIRAALASVNGRADSHTYTAFADIERVTVIAERQLEALIGGKSNWTGAIVWDRSGDGLPNAYKYSRVCTSIKLVRKSTGWFLESIAAVTAYKDAGKTTVYLTADQDALAVAKVRKQYTVQSSSGLKVMVYGESGVGKTTFGVAA